MYKSPWETHFVRITHLSGHQRAIGQNGQNAQFSGKSNFFHLSPDLSGMGTGPNRPPWDPFRSPKLPVSTPDCDRYHRGTAGACATLESGMSIFQPLGGSNIFCIVCIHVGVYMSLLLVVLEHLKLHLKGEGA